MLLFKIIGLLLILAASTLFGLLKANSLKKRADKLGKICISLSKLAQLILSGAGELKALFSLSFEKEILAYNENTPIINKSFLESKDIELLNNFLKEIGMSDSESEYKRITVYKTLFEKQLAEAEKRFVELSKLYNSLGFLTGLSICIFLI